MFTWHGPPALRSNCRSRQFNRPCRIYAPVGTHKDLFGYLVRRLFENGANSSFVNRLADEKHPLKKLLLILLHELNHLKANLIHIFHYP